MIDHLPIKECLPYNVSLEFAKQLFFSMSRIRAVEETIALRYAEGKMRCPTHLSIGQEAVAVGVCAALNKKDFAVSSHRAHAHYLAKGGDLKAMLAELYGKVTGCDRGKGGSMHLNDLSVNFMGSTSIVGNSIPVGVGLGLSIQIKQMDNLSCIFFGDGAIEEGAFFEAANFAVLKKLPVLFICENNFYSVYSPLSVRQPVRRKIYKLAEAIGMQSTFGDGNNVLEVHHLTQNAILEIAKNNGPCFIEFTTYRWREHCGPNYDNHIGYRTEQEFLEWKSKDPIVHLSKILYEFENNSQYFFNINQKIQDEIEQAFEFAEDSPFPEQHEASQHVYKEKQI